MRSINLFTNDQLQKKLIKLKYKKFALGKAAYEHTMRNFVNKMPSKQDNYLFYIALSQGLYSIEKSKKIFTDIKISNFVLSELQYIPNRIFFTQSLQKKILVYSRVGGNVAEDLTVRIYQNLKHIDSIRIKLSEELVFFLRNKSNLKKKCNNFFEKNNFKKQIGIEENYIELGYIKKPKIIKFNNKVSFSNYFNLDSKKKNILILPHIINDNLFTAEWSLFETPLAWFVETLKKINSN